MDVRLTVAGTESAPMVQVTFRSNHVWAVEVLDEAGDVVELRVDALEGSAFGCFRDMAVLLDKEVFLHTGESGAVVELLLDVYDGHSLCAVARHAEPVTVLNDSFKH